MERNVGPASLNENTSCYPTAAAWWASYMAEANLPQKPMLAS